MAMSQTEWIDGMSNSGGKERICPKRHVQQKEWQNPEWNEGFGGTWQYDYISDYECPFPYKNHKPILNELSENGSKILKAAKQQGYPIAIKNLVHYTDKKDGIITSGGFIGGKKKINETNDEDVYAYLFWCATRVEKDDITGLQDHMGNCFMKVFDHDINIRNDIKDQFGVSKAFGVYSKSRQGKECSHYFQYSMDDLLKIYQDYIGDEEIKFRILGTFAYITEVMHSVLVCSEGAGNNEFAEYPLVPQENNVVTRDNKGKFWWYPQATGKEIKRFDCSKYPMYRRYDCVSFAFHVREGEIFCVDDLKTHLHETQS